MPTLTRRKCATVIDITAIPSGAGFSCPKCGKDYLPKRKPMAAVPLQALQHGALCCYDCREFIPEGDVCRRRKRCGGSYGTDGVMRLHYDLVDLCPECAAVHDKAVSQGLKIGGIVALVIIGGSLRLLLGFFALCAGLSIIRKRR
jgi:hypothetical protein